jgi:hypothetical protein
VKAGVLLDRLDYDIGATQRVETRKSLTYYGGVLPMLVAVKRKIKNLYQKSARQGKLYWCTDQGSERVSAGSLW